MQENGTPQQIPAQDRSAAVRFHDRIADEWDAKYQKGGFRKRAHFFETRVLPRIRAPGRWLDAGCGSGYFSRLLAAKGLQVVGADASRPMVEAARRLSAAAGLDGLAFEIVPTVECLPFSDTSFDGCICLSVIEYLSDPNACLMELARVIAPGGTLVLSLPHRLAPIRLTQRLAFTALRTMVPGKWEYSVLSRNAVTKTGLSKILANHGFKMQNALGFDPVMAAGLLRLVPPSLIFAVALKEGSLAGAAR